MCICDLKKNASVFMYIFWKMSLFHSISKERRGNIKQLPKISTQQQQEDIIVSTIEWFSLVVKQQVVEVSDKHMSRTVQTVPLEFPV